MVQSIIKGLFGEVIQADKIEFFYKGLDPTSKEKLDKEIIKQLKMETEFDKNVSINILGIFKHIDLPKTVRNPDVNKNICIEFAKENFPDKIIEIRLDSYPVSQSNTIDICIVYEIKKISIREHLENVFKIFKDDEREIYFRCEDVEFGLCDKKMPVNKMCNRLSKYWLSKFCINSNGELKSLYDFTENHIKQYFLNPKLYIYEFHANERSYPQPYTGLYTDLYVDSLPNETDETNDTNPTIFETSLH